MMSPPVSRPGALPAVFPIGDPIATVCPHCGKSLDAAAPKLTTGDLELNVWTRRVSRRGGPPIRVSNKEYRLLELLMRNPERVLSESQILEAAWEFSRTESNVVGVYVSTLRKKLGAGGTMIVTERGFGYRLAVAG